MSDTDEPVTPKKRPDRGAELFAKMLARRGPLPADLRDEPHEPEAFMRSADEKDPS